MKKITLSLIALVVILFGAFIAWSCYKDVLALLLFIISFIPAHWFEEGRQELKNRQDNA